MKRNPLPRIVSPLLAFGMLAALVSGCHGSGTAENSLSPGSTAATPIDPDAPVRLVIRSHFDGWQHEIEQFEKLHPNIQVDHEVIPLDEMGRANLESLAVGQGPDIMIVENESLGLYNSIEGLEDLLQPPYDAGAYESEISPALWKAGMTIDRRKLIGMPIWSNPLVTYYRADIMEKYGFPSDPDELGRYMEDPQRWLAMSEKLNKDGIWITQWDIEAIQLFERTQGLFDEQFRFNRNNPEFVKAIDISRTVNRLSIDANMDIWSEAGQEALREGKFAMLYLGVWGVDSIKGWAPDQIGLWRETRLPFGLNGWGGSTHMMIPSYSPNKQAAWELIRYIVKDGADNGGWFNVPAYAPAQGNAKDMTYAEPYFYGQLSHALNQKLASTIEAPVVTPLDKKAADIWNSVVSGGVNNDQDSQAILDNVQKKIEQQLGDDIRILSAPPSSNE